MSIGFEKHGSGRQIVVMLHEWLGDHTNWHAVVPYLNLERDTYLLADLRGYGLSRHITGSYHLEEAGQDVLGLLDQLGHERFHLVCHSMSALVGQWLAQKARARVKSLFAISPVPPCGFKMDEQAFARLLSAIHDDTAAKDAISARTGSRYGQGWLTRKLAVARASATDAAMEGYARMFTSSDISDGARGLDVPIRAMTGKYDIPIYLEASVREKFQTLYTSFDLVSCNESGHYSMVEAPVFTAAQIEKFVGSHLEN
jgi:3-oxoadipate enol-lactonase